MIIDDIDFAELYRSHIGQASRRSKPAEDWDKRAEDMAKSCANPNDPYVRTFIKPMILDGAATLLDVGCGPGTIALPLASKFKEVYALDYSQKMLDVLKMRAKNENIGNVTTILKSWNDDWRDVPQCDIAVASRATMVDDLKDALEKISNKARLWVYTTFTVDRHFIDPKIIACLRRKAVGFPNYIYAVNLLHAMGYRPRVDYITTTMCKKKPAGLEGFLSSVVWSVGDISEEEKKKLKNYYQEHVDVQERSDTFERTWAYVYWSTMK
ncbi:MAG: class I SAM-dependent methyltransferase [Burkholderiales bacterium]|jgi:SAM-dependent methyltransferase|nr:class I SAM-dependent methyltransferase [Burkholderiales bacterium]